MCSELHTESLSDSATTVKPNEKISEQNTKPRRLCAVPIFVRVWLIMICMQNLNLTGIDELAIECCSLPTDELYDNGPVAY